MAINSCIYRACSTFNLNSHRVAVKVPDIMPLSETMYIMAQMDELRRRMGVVYPMD